MKKGKKIISKGLCLLLVASMMFQNAAIAGYAEETTQELSVLEEVEEIEKTEDTEEVEEVEKTEDTEEVEEVEKTEDTEEVEEVEKTEDTEEVEEVEKTEDTEEVEEVEETEDTEEVEKVEETETTEKIEEKPIVEQPKRSFSSANKSMVRTASARNSIDNILKFSIDAPLIGGYIKSINNVPAESLTISNGCVVLDGGFTNKEIPIVIQMEANDNYQYCIAYEGWSGSLSENNRGGVSVDGKPAGSGEKWDTEYPRSSGFNYNASVDVKLISSGSYQIYGTRSVKIHLRRLGSDGKPQGGGVYSLPLLFLKEGTVSATSSISSWFPDNGTPKLTANWKLGDNTNITASYQWYKKNGNSYTDISGANEQVYCPTASGTYKVKISLKVNSILSGVQEGTYTTSSEITVDKKSSDAEIKWKDNSNPLTVNLGERVSMSLYSGTQGKFVIKKNNNVFQEYVIDSGNVDKNNDRDFGQVTLDKAGTYTWEFSPNYPNLFDGASGSLQLTVNRLSPNASVAVDSEISTLDYQGNIKLNAGVPGTFKIHSKNEAGTVIVFEETSYSYVNQEISIPIYTLIQGVPAGCYKLYYTFTPDSENYLSAEGNVNYSIIDQSVIKINQTEGGTVSVNGTTNETFASKVGETLTIVVNPSTEENCSSEVLTITVDGQQITDVTSNTDGSVTAQFTPTESEKTYEISATYDLKKLMLKPDQVFYLDEEITSTNLKAIEQEVFETIFDAVNSTLPELNDAEIVITYHAGEVFDIYVGRKDVYPKLD